MRIPSGNGAEPVVAAQEERKLFWGMSASPCMRALETAIAGIAASGVPVLLMGETGTGKEVVAFAIHQISESDGGCFTKVHCAGLRPADFSGILERCERGAVRASRHTIFLDGISDLDGACQARIAEFHSGLDNGPGEYQRGVRFVSASSRSLDEAMRAGQFRQDLYYRLGGVCLRLPPLRQRREDIPLLADFFLEKYAALFLRPRSLLSPWAAGLLGQYAWPGNIRELENTMKGVAARGDERKALRDFDGLPASSSAWNSRTSSLKEAAREASRRAERDLILKALVRTRWNRKRAAEDLQISYKALLYKLKQTGLAESNSPDSVESR
ncbi:MAG TPA: sigma 54-interacting transcriptional regulator [Terriglobia bacterium]|nr:sigma 54-interacting transcriptional regulator [Terriglobia bacterium]